MMTLISASPWISQPPLPLSLATSASLTITAHLPVTTLGPLALVDGLSPSLYCGFGFGHYDVLLRGLPQLLQGKCPKPQATPTVIPDILSCLSVHPNRLAERTCSSVELMR